MVITQPNIGRDVYPSIELRDIPVGTIFRHSSDRSALCYKANIGVVDLYHSTCWTAPHTLFINYQACNDVELIVRDKR